MKSHVFKEKKLDKDIQQENKLRPKTVEECSNFSQLVLKLSDMWSDASSSKQAIKNEISNIKELEQDNLNNLIEYLEYLILTKGQNEFIVPYYSISTDIGHQIDFNIAKHEHSHFGILGDVHSILDN